MSNTYRISGSGNVFTNILRGVFLAAAAIGGFFMLAFSAAFAFFVVTGLLLLGAFIFAFLWGRAKLFGKPFGPKAKFEAARKDMEAQFQDLNKGPNGFTGPSETDGPIIEAHRTPEGWSVED